MHAWTARSLRSGLATLVVVASVLAASSVATPAEAASSAWFRSPSGNIGCYMTANWVRCDVNEYTYAPPPKPASCDFAWGPSFDIGLAGKGRLGCVSDTVGGSPRVLRYGRSLTVGPFRCTSRSSGMTCTNTRSEHGFTISRVAYRLF